MRIVHVIGYFQPEFGYEEGFTAITQHNAGNDVHIITSKFCAPFNGLSKTQRIRNDSEYFGVTIHRLKSLELYTDLIFLLGLNELLIKLNPDIIHAHTTTQLASIQAVYYSKRYGIPYVIDCHEFNFKGSSLNPIRWTLKTLLKYIEFRFFRLPLYRFLINHKSSTHFISVAPVCSEYLRSEFKAEIEKISELNLSVMIRDKLNSTFKKDNYGWKGDDLVFLFTGIVGKRKKLLNYLIIFKNLPRKYKLLMVLQGDTIELEQYISHNSLEEKIKIIKDVKSKDIKQFFEIADIGLWLYNNSISYLESMAYGLPVCIIDLQLTYLVPKDLLFLLPNNLNLDQIESYLLKADFSKENLEYLAVKGQEYVSENLSYDKYVEDLQRVYQNVISNYGKN